MAKRNPVKRGTKRSSGRRAGGGPKRVARPAAKARERQAAKRGAPAAAKRSAATRTAKRKSASRAAASRSRRKPSTRKPAASGSAVTAATRKVRGGVAAVVQRVAGSLPWSGDDNDPITMLEADHRRFETLLKQGEETTERAVKGRTELLDTLTAELDAHELVEEQVLYPALKPHTETREVVLEGAEEHHVADVIVKELHELAKDNERWGAKFKVLQESLEHHIQEEEGRMFPAARKVLSSEELQTLGARMRELKAETRRHSRS